LLLVVLGGAAAFDVRATLGWQRVRAPGLLPLMQGVSWLGFQPQAGYLTFGAIAFLFARRLHLEGGFALLALLCGFLSGPIKGLIERPRPVAEREGIVVQFAVGGYSFPSGHVLTYTIFGGFLAYLTYTLVGWRPLHVGLLAFLLGLIALVGPRASTSASTGRPTPSPPTSSARRSSSPCWPSIAWPRRDNSPPRHDARAAHLVAPRRRDILTP
jgi:hypothetical protein